MTRLFSIIFVSSLMLGFVYGWLQDVSGIHMLISTIVGGFFGSFIAAGIFTYDYFTHEETDEKNQQLKDEINSLERKK